MSTDSNWERLLRRHGADVQVLDELFEYAEPRFRHGKRTLPRDYPLPDEPHVAAWEQYAVEAQSAGVVEVLRRKLVQLRFPIAPGISSDPAYLASTRRGSPSPEHLRGVTFMRPETVSLFIHETPAGRIPILVAEERSDFAALVQALVHRNEPTDIPPAQGACIVSGYNNWDRVHRYRDSWQQNNVDATARDWQIEFRRLVPQRERYQDRFILLSGGAYSGVPASHLDLSRDRWLRISSTIRREHECVHYFTRRVLGSMSNTLHDELIADYVGMTIALGEYRPDWFLYFMGLENFPRFRTSGRLGSYRGDPPLSAPAFNVLQSMVVSAASGVAVVDPLGRDGHRDHAAVASAIRKLAFMPLFDLVSAGEGRRASGVVSV